MGARFPGPLAPWGRLPHVLLRPIRYDPTSGTRAESSQAVAPCDRGIRTGRSGPGPPRRGEPAAGPAPRAVVLCYLEGLTHEQAAERLRCPVGTVRSRLTTARERLRGRLERRGFASSVGVMPSVLAAAASAGPIPAALVESAVRIGFRSGTGASVGGMVPASVVALAERGLKTMWYSRLTVLSLVLLAIGGGTIGTIALAQRGPAAQEPVAPARLVSGLPATKDTARQPARPANEQARRKLLEERIETVRQILREQEQLFQRGEIGFDDVPPWSRRLMEARLSLASTPAERLAALREHRNRMLVCERRLVRLAEAGQVKFLDTLMAKSYRLEADELLVEAGGDLSQEEPMSEKKAVPGPLPDPAPQRP